MPASMLPLLLTAALVLLPAEIIRLRDGTLVHGRIVDFNEAVGFTLERVDTGGVVTLRWENLPASEVRRIKESRGFTGEDPQPWLVNVVHLVLRNGTTETGVLVDDGRRDVYTLRRRQGVESFPRQYVKSVESGRVDGLAVYAPTDLYQVILEELGVPSSAAEHLRMAVACEGAGLYEGGRDHYGAVQQLDPALKKELVAQRLERVRIKIEDRAETEFIDGIRNRLYKNEFDEALLLVGAFRERYPASRQLGDLAGLEGEIGRRRHEHYAARIISDYHSFLGKTLGEIARNDAMTLGAALELMESSVHEEVVERLSRTYGMDAALVESLWVERSGGSVRTSSYGTGTFILGPDKALDWIGAGEDGAEDETVPEPEEADDLEARIKKVLEQRAREAASRQKSAASRKTLSEGITPDEWWQRASTDDRERWLVAYYAEFGGHLGVLRAKPRDCRICSAQGVIEVFNEKNEIEAQTCPTCKGLKFERIVNYR
jgi:hypothetical protein